MQASIPDHVQERKKKKKNEVITKKGRKQWKETEKERERNAGGNGTGVMLFFFTPLSRLKSRESIIFTHRYPSTPNGVLPDSTSYSVLRMLLSSLFSTILLP